MIRVFSNPAITWTLTTILLLSASYHILAGIKSQQRKDQINNSLHALMHLLMAAMLWHLAPSTMLAQIMLLTAAASWFFLQAIARPEFKILCTNSHARLKCLYHSLTMTGAALMIAMMGGVSTTGFGIAPSSDGMAGMVMSHNHHTMAAPIKTTAATISHSPNLAILPTIIFTTAAIVFTILLLRRQTPNTTHHQGTTRKPNIRKEHGLEALGATTMALMFATMST